MNEESFDFLYLDLFVGIIIVTRDIIEKSCIPFGLGAIGCRLISFIQVCIASELSRVIVFVGRERSSSAKDQMGCS